MPKIINYSEYVGKTFNHLTLLRDLGFSKCVTQLNRIFIVRCNLCNSEKEMPLYEVKSNRVKSCGCEPRGKKHGKCYTDIYKVWSRIKTRCYDSSSKPYVNYGGRGIIMCDEWRNNFLCFENWATQNGYSPELEIDRINNNGNYEPCNCRWASCKQQANNRRNTVFFELRGERLPNSEWCDRLGLDRHGIAKRLKKGWSLERALTEKSNCLK